MGTWGVGLYQSDDASDLRDEFREVVRAPWDGDRLRAWAQDAYPDDSTDLRLALADLFWSYGIDHHDVFAKALEVVDGGADLDSKRRLGMSERDLKKRSTILDQLAAKLRSTNLKPRNRRMIEAPEPFLFAPGDCLIYPTSEGRVRNPYVSPAREAAFYTAHAWERDGWAAAITLGCVHRFETFARYLVAVLRHDDETEPALGDFATLSILHSRTYSHDVLQRVHLVSTTSLHLKRMRVSIVGNLPVHAAKVEAAFGRELETSGREFANDAWTLPDTYRYRPERLTPADVRDPIAAFLA
jgi:hypothetical protein